MEVDIYDLSYVFDIQRWEKLQDSLALLTGMGVTIVDFKGVPVTKHSNYCPFCESVRADPQLGKYCQVCDSRAGLEAIRMWQPYVYLCHFNLIDVAIPIQVNGHYLGALMVGQVKPIGPTPLKSLEKLFSAHATRRASEHMKLHQKEYDAIPAVSFEELNKKIELLSAIVNYIVEKAAERSQALLSYQQLFTSSSLISSETFPSANKTNTSNNSSSRITNRPHLPLPSKKEHPGNRFSVIQPAFEYIEKRICENVTQRQVADYCNLSQSYFCRIFVQQTGTNFSQFLSTRKIALAKEWLQDTDKSIVQISEDLGFTSPGYFIKVFKKHEGVTPLLYRRYYQNNYLPVISEDTP